jgi:hypothetical protein
MNAAAESALLIAVSRRHLTAAAEICASDGSVTLPVLEAGDLAAAAPGTAVLILAAAVGDEESRSVTWRGRLVSWSTERPADVRAPVTVDHADAPDGTVHAESLTTPASASPGDPIGHDDALDDDDPPADPVWIVIAGLEELALRDRIHTNELVRKRDRGARFFVPEAPRLVRLPD